jgi:methylated-DNA-[protein]-cysteine S-methyltransferase
MTDFQLLRNLRGLRAEAPSSLLPDVLAEVGLVDSYAPMASAIGPMLVAFGKDGITAVIPADEEEALVAGYPGRHGRGLRRIDAVPDRVLRQPRFDLSRLTDFERSVLEVTRTIPAGQVRPYSWVAREIGRPGAVRAVGSALGRNPVPLLIPCHRVVRSDGRIGDYAFGTTAKRSALAAEGVDPDLLEERARKGVRYMGSDTTHIYCHPTCRYGRRLTERHTVTFASAAAAQAAGYRPCKVCRP